MTWVDWVVLALIALAAIGHVRRMNRIEQRLDEQERQRIHIPPKRR